MIYKKDKSVGYTIVELTVVVIVIGILITLSIFGYSGWRDSVARAELESDLNSVYSAMENIRNWDNGYRTLDGGVLFDGSEATRDIYVQSENVTLTYRDGDKLSYCVDAVSNVRPSITMHLATHNGNKEPKVGMCP